MSEKLRFSASWEPLGGSPNPLFFVLTEGVRVIHREASMMQESDAFQKFDAVSTQRGMRAPQQTGYQLLFTWNLRAIMPE